VKPRVAARGKVLDQSCRRLDGKGREQMDKKAKKRLDVINKKLQALRPRLTGARSQDDDPGEVKALEDEITKLEAEAAELKGKP